MRSRAMITKIFFVFLLVFLGFIVMLQPSNHRHWDTDVSVLPKINIDEDQIVIDGFRNFRWDQEGLINAEWDVRTFNLEAIESLALIVEPFKDSDLMAHTMLQFGFADGQKIIVSVEARKEKNEKYGLIQGAMRQFELIYIFGDEHDLLPLRAIHRQAHVYIYPIRADKKFIRNLLLDLIQSANALHTQPQFYRSISDNCTTTLVQHIDRHVAGQKIGLRFETLFPAQTGKLLHRMGFMDTDLSYEEAKKYFRVDDDIRKKFFNSDFLDENAY